MCRPSLERLLKGAKGSPVLEVLGRRPNEATTSDIGSTLFRSKVNALRTAFSASRDPLRPRSKMPPMSTQAYCTPPTHQQMRGHRGGVFEHLSGNPHIPAIVAPHSFHGSHETTHTLPGFLVGELPPFEERSWISTRGQSVRNASCSSKIRNSASLFCVRATRTSLTFHACIAHSQPLAELLNAAIHSTSTSSSRAANIQIRGLLV